MFGIITVNQMKYCHKEHERQTVVHDQLMSERIIYQTFIELHDLLAMPVTSIITLTKPASPGAMCTRYFIQCGDQTKAKCMTDIGSQVI